MRFGSMPFIPKRSGKQGDTRATMIHIRPEREPARDFVPRICNPEGIGSFSPRLRGTSYPGFQEAMNSTPTGLCHGLAGQPQPRSSRREEAHFNFRFFRWSLLTSAATVTALVFLLTTLAPAQDSQFLFDPNGNLLVQTAEVSAPPQILGQPQNRIVAPGEAAAFSVVAENTRALTYQWRFNGGNIGGATNDSVILPNVSTNNEGEYRVVLTNPSGSVTSAPAFLMLDSDADGVADSWELTFFSNLGQTATADSDGDRVSNLQEFLDDTNPTNSVSARYRLLVLRDGGSVIRTPDQASYTNGESVTLTAIASANDSFHAWLGDIVTRNNPVTLVMTNDKTVYARFTPIEFTWTGLAGSDWNSTTNWTPNLVPATNDNASITIGATVTLNTSGGCRDLLLGSATGNPVLTGSGTLTIGGTFLWTSGTMSGSGKTLISAGATLAVDNPNGVTLNGRILENSGTINWIGGGGMTLFSGAVITNRPGALFHVQNAALLASSGSGIRFDNAGTFRKSVNAGTSTIGSSVIGNSVSFNNSGTVEIQSGTLLCNGEFTNHGTVNLSPATTNRLAAGGSANGTFNASNTALVEWTGSTFALDAGAQLNGTGLYKINSSTLTRNADLTVDNLDLAVGTLSVTGTLTVATSMNWITGTMSGSGRTIIDANATLNLAVPSLNQASLVSRTLENGGTVVWTGAGSFAVNSGAVVTNRAGALFDVQNAASLSAGAGANRFDNAGTFRKSTSAGSTAVNSIFNNSGTVDIQTGTLLFNGSFTNNGVVQLSGATTNRLAGGGSATGTFETPATAVVEWTGGTFTLNPGAQLNGAGPYKLNGGIVTANANLTVAKLDLVSVSSTLNGTGTVIIASAMNWTAGTMSGSGRTIIPVAATLQAGSASGVGLQRTLENGGTILWTGAGGVSLLNGVVTNRAGGLFDAQNAAQFSFGGGACRFDNAGTFRKSANAGITTLASGVSLNNFGTVEIQTGTLLCNGSFNNNNIVNLSAGTTNRLAGGGSATGTFETPATALVEWTGGTFTLNPGAQLNGAGPYKLNGGTVTANANLTVAKLDLDSGSSTLNGTGTVIIASAMNWTAGTMSGSGRTIIPFGASLQVGNPSGVGLQRTLENGGTVLWTGAGGIILLNGVVTNRAGGLFEAKNSAQFFFAGGACRFDNAGTFRKSVNTGITTVPSGVSFNNSGTVDIRSGKLAANGGYVSSSNALLNCALGGTTPGTNHGQLQVGGSVTLNGTLSVDLLPGFTPATNDTFTVLTAATRNGAFGSFTYPANRVTMQMSNTPNSVVLRVGDVLPIPQPTLFAPELASPNVRLIWTATSNVTYRLEFNPDLSNLINWSVLPGDVTTLSNTASKLDALTTSNRFYRIRVLP